MDTPVRPTCHMPGCSTQVASDQKYCAACAWIKAKDIKEALAGR